MIRYTFELSNARKAEFQVNMNRKYSKEIDREVHAPWTNLPFYKCRLCPLSDAEYLHCPTAVDVEEAMKEFADISSESAVSVKVETPERTFLRTCDVQTGLNSLVGLIMASSGCPILSRLKSLAKFHLPFSNIEETIYRTVGNYLIKQYLIQHNGGKPDFELVGLANLYKDLEVVNDSFFKRISEISKSDSNLNVLANLSCLSNVVRTSIADRLDSFKDTIQL